MSLLNSLHTPTLVMRLKNAEVKYRLLTRGTVVHIVIDATDLKVYGEG